MTRTLLLSLGAILGANARYWLGVWAIQRLGAHFPFGTLLVNVSGCLLIGLINGIGAGERWPISQETRLFLVVGFLGAYTTFSSFGMESYALLQSEQPWLGVLNMGASLLIGMLAVASGFWLGRLFN